MSSPRRRGLVKLALVGLLAVGPALAAACDGGEDRGSAVEVVVREGEGAATIGRRLRASGLVGHPRLFALYAALRGTEGELQAGRYRFPRDAGWGEILEAMESGGVVTEALTVPEGFTLREIAPGVGALSEVPPDSVLALARDSGVVRRLGVPGPSLEGYLFPETYHFAGGVSPLEVLRAMTARYRSFWGSPERARARELGMSEREVVTLASIVEEEARLPAERPIIAGVYHNRLERGMRLQADPTVQYALEAPKERLLYRDIERVADDPYNTYTHAGLPPGPIASPGAGSLRAALWPADVPYLFFVARPDGSHVFTETAREHVNATNRIRRQREEER